jgi:prepilin-type N-terminal cleavage/methylation domain-containing protein
MRFGMRSNIRSLPGKRRGFTLLEVLVVIIIVGVLAAVAVPQLFSVVERSRAVEALNMIGVIKRAFYGCLTPYAGGYDASFIPPCGSWDELGMSDPNADADKLFTYGILIESQGFYITVTYKNDPTGQFNVRLDKNTGELLFQDSSGPFAGMLKWPLP